MLKQCVWIQQSSPVIYDSTLLLAAVAVFSDLNIDGCCDDHGVPLFVLSLLGSHDSVSLCVVLLHKIRFVYVSFYNSDVNYCLNHIIFFYICATFSRILQIYLQAEMRTELRL